ncbi:unnamed protein product [Schistosoma margrebowiei]|uniref:Uncharacterized protein n=1 Tax=Schistosoma margrebowiei TaxID=48269 RepID=A0A3P8DDX9_9TREM|nr:unnamed protein product [Schistosoma margrebowiei]
MVSIFTKLDFPLFGQPITATFRTRASGEESGC